MKIGILGGSFDPIHLGHINLSLQAIKEFGLKEVWLMPTFNPPHKDFNKLTDFDIRLEMLRLISKEYPKLVHIDFERNLKEKTYTYKVLRELKQAYKEKQFYFIMGADSLFEIETWKSYEILLKENSIIVAGREYKDKNETLVDKVKYYNEKFDADIKILHFEEINISSSDIRRLAKNKEDISIYLPKVINNYIISNELYL